MSSYAKDPPLFERLRELNSAQALLEELGFGDWRAARKVFQRMAAKDPTGIHTVLDSMLPILRSAADPDRSLVNLERYLDGNCPTLFTEFKKNPRLIEVLVTIFSNSPFLTEITLRTPGALELLGNRHTLIGRKSIEQFESEALKEVKGGDNYQVKLDGLRRYQRQELLRIGTDDFLGLYDLRSVISQLSRMATGLVRACLALASEQTRIQTGGFSILAMGKLGGWELNYSSDIDLLFAARNFEQGHIQLAKQLVANLTTMTEEGFLYRVDLRLRPWGRDGPLITTPDGFRSYIKDHAQLWEKQAFLKARPIAGNLSIGEELRTEVEPFLRNNPPEEVQAGVFAMKKRTEEILKEKGRTWGEVKLGAGSIRDIEFVVQTLQMSHGEIRTRSTLKALPGLARIGLITPSEAHTLSNGYVFLRTIEHYLQIMDYRQVNSIPSEPTAIALLARRLGFEGIRAGEQFIEQFEKTTLFIRSIFMNHVGNTQSAELSEIPNGSLQVLKHIAQMDSSYKEAFDQDEIKQHAGLISRLVEEGPVIIDAKPLEEAHWKVTAVGEDTLGLLSIICGLFFIYGMDIIESKAFTYETAGRENFDRAETDSEVKDLRGVDFRKVSRSRPKIVDIFTVRATSGDMPTPETWLRYRDDLAALIEKMNIGEWREASGELARRVGEMYQASGDFSSHLYPIEIEFDNESSEKYTILQIGGQDTVGFLYELSNALAISRINIARMFVQSLGTQVNDTLYVNDEQGLKITAIEKQRELRAATVLIKHFTHLLPHAPDPKAALLHFRDFVTQLLQRPNWPAELAKMEQPQVLDGLARLLGMSDFLWDDFLRMQYSNLFPVVRDVEGLSVVKNCTSLQIELNAILEKAAEWRRPLNEFKDREMFRIDMRHILGYSKEYWDFSNELADLVEVVLRAAFDRCNSELEVMYGEPLLADGQICKAALMALGKCGGRELGYASDIELMLVYEGDGKGPEGSKLSPAFFYEELIRRMVDAIQSRQEGIFHIDLQLRPYGKAGSQAVSLESFCNYYAPKGPAWAYERQALVKLRPIGGDAELGDLILGLRDGYVYSDGRFDATAMRAMRERQLRHLVTPGIFNAKYSPGALVDLEYFIQGLQINHGAAIPSVRSTNIREGMAELAKSGILSESDFENLRKAHTFFSWLIDSLRVVRGNNRDVNLPAYGSDEYAFLAKRLRYSSGIERLREDLVRYPREILEVSSRLLD